MVFVNVHSLAVDQLAAVIRNRLDKVLIIDSRSFLEFNTCHVLNSVNVCCSKIVKRRLQQDKVSVKEFLAHTCQIDSDETFDVIVYDQGSVEVSSLPVDSFVHVLLSKLSDVFKSVGLLRGGFLEFQASHPSLCEDKTRKCCPMTSLSQPCMSISNLGPTRILPFLYLGSQADALNKELLQDHNITYELNVSTSCPQPEFIQEGHFLRIAVNDNYSEKLLPYFPRAFQFLDKVQEANGCVLIHCLAGISRSPTVAIAYIMKHLHMSSDEAYRYVKSKRATISPNFNFLGQLLEFERQLQAENVLKGKDVPTTALPFPSGPKRQCRTDMRSTSKLALNLDLPVTTMDAVLCSSPDTMSSTVLLPRPGDQSPTTGIAKLSFHTANEYDDRVLSTEATTSSRVFKMAAAADTHEMKYSRFSCKTRFSSMMAVKEESQSSESKSSSYVMSCESKRLFTSKVQIMKSSVGESTGCNVTRSSATSAFNFVPSSSCRSLGVESSHLSPSPDREFQSRKEVPLLSMEKSHDSLTDSIDSLTSSRCTSGSMCSSWNADVPDYCRSDSTSTSGLGSEVSDLDSCIDSQSVAGPLSPKREIIIDDEEVMLRKPRFLLPGPVSYKGRERNETKARDSGNPLSPSDSPSAVVGSQSHQAFSFWEKASSKGNVEASHDSGIVTSPMWSECEEFATNWFDHGSSTATTKASSEKSISQSTKTSSKGLDVENFTSTASVALSTVTQSEKSTSKREIATVETKAVTTREAFSSLMAKHFIGTVISGRDNMGTVSTTSKDDGLYRAHSCPGILSWLQCSSSSLDIRTPPFTTAASFLASSGPRLRKLNLSSLGKAERFRNRYSCGSLDCTDLERFIFDSCPDFGHFGHCHSSTKSLEGGGGGGVDKTPLSPTHRTFGRNARVIPVS